MAQFQISDENDARRCLESLRGQFPITITATVKDKIEAFSGIVQSVEDQGRYPPRWRVTMIESK
jgi:hypothetical protein